MNDPSSVSAGARSQKALDTVNGMDQINEWEVLVQSADSGVEWSMTVMGRTAEIARTEVRSVTDALILEITRLEP